MTTVFTLSAIDLFASAMGAFIIITIVLMPDYQKEVRLEGHFEALDALARASETLLDDTEMGLERLQVALAEARSRQRDLQQEARMLSGELGALDARLAALQRPQPPPATDEKPVDDRFRRDVTFRFLGLKSEQTRYLFLVDMNRYLGEDRALVVRTVGRALDSLQPGFEFGILGFQQLDSGPRFHAWPAGGAMAPVTADRKAQAMRWLADRGAEFAGGSPMLAAFRHAFEGPIGADGGAIVLFSDGLPNPAFNDGLPSRALAQAITLANDDGVEIHAVTIGDYFKYKGTVVFMETLARANSGEFLALAQ